MKKYAHLIGKKIRVKDRTGADTHGILLDSSREELLMVSPTMILGEEVHLVNFRWNDIVQVHIDYKLDDLNPEYKNKLQKFGLIKRAE